jgi:hypothetical protein
MNRDSLSLKRVDRAEIVTLMDNYIDALHRLEGNSAVRGGVP